MRGHATQAGEGMVMQEHVPELIGTPTQVSWAEQVRRQKLAEMERYVDKMVASEADRLAPAEREALRTRIMRRFAPILAQTSARYWVNLAP